MEINHPILHTIHVPSNNKAKILMEKFVKIKYSEQMASCSLSCGNETHAFG